MERWNKFIGALKNPRPWLAVCVLLVTAGSAAGAILLAAMGETEFPLSILTYALYFVAILSLSYSVYMIVIAVPKAKARIVETMQKRAFTARILQQYGFRTVVFASISFTISIGYVVFNGVIAAIELSIWYGALAAYYLLLALMRGGVLLFHRPKKRAEDVPPLVQAKQAVKIYRRCGAGLVVLPVCLSFAILQMVRGVNSFEHAGMMIYVSALYAFYKIVMSVVNIFKARRSDDMTVRALRSINLADAMVSILALQTAMFKEFGGGFDYGPMNAATGAAVCALTAALGVFMIVYSYRKMKEVQTAYENGQQQRQ